MNKQIFILNDSKGRYSKENINKLIAKINELKINKDMKKIILIASLNLLSSVKTTKALEYQLQTFRNQGQITIEKTQSKYINTLIREINELSASDYTTTINNLIDYINNNKINIKV